MSKKGLKKQQKEAEKAAKKQQQQEQAAATAAESAGGDAADCAVGCYGVMPMIQSKEKIDRTIVRLGDLTAARAGEKVWVRGRLHTSRAVGKYLMVVRIVMIFPFKLSNVILRHSSFPHTSTFSTFEVAYKNALYKFTDIIIIIIVIAHIPAELHQFRICRFFSVCTDGNIIIIIIINCSW